MDEFRLFLHANQWKGTHVRKQMKKFALLARRTGSTFSKTYQELAQAWNMEESRQWVRDRNIRWVIQKQGHEEQRTDAWHNARSTMITASEVGDVVDGTPATRQEVMMRKLGPPKTETRNGNFLNNPLMWGTILEPIAKAQQELDTACAITDVSCVRHRKQPFLGASPDGIIQAPTDRERHHCLVEFKCPKSRKIGGEIPKNQIHQMQLQMACTGVDECEQVEFQQEVVTYTQQVDCTDKPKGIIALQDNGKTEHWDKPVGAIEEGRLIFWILQGVSRDLVLRDPAWLPTHLPKLREFWDEVETHRENHTKPDKPGVLKLEL